MIHPTAVVSPGANIEKEVEIGPYAVVGEEVNLGRGTRVGPHAFIENWTTVGEECTIGSGAIIGGAPQDVDYKGQRSFVQIGDRTKVREYVTIHRSKEPEGATSVGSDCYLMAYCHLGHDCLLEDRVVVVNTSNLAGHVTVETGAFISGAVQIHQFTRVGKLSLVGALSPIRKDILPYTIVEGHPPRVRGLNVVGRRRAGVAAEARNALKRALKILLNDESRVVDAAKTIKKSCGEFPEVRYFAEFLESTERGFHR